jgi:hypothetical protein
MSNQEWWAAERKAAEFWRKVRENQMGRHNHNSLNQERGAAPTARNQEFSTPMRRQLPGI